MLNCGATNSSGEDPVLSANEVVIQMGSGVNIGNTFDLDSHDTSPALNKLIIDTYIDAGMDHIRIPVTWMDGYSGDHLADEAGNINFSHPRFKDLENVVDYALSKGLYVTINTHHEHWLFDSYDGSDEIDAVFSNLWTQIATHFKDYPQRLIFEVWNEPQGNFGEWGGSVVPGDARGIALTRQINNVGYHAIRATGGNNEQRIIQIGVNGMGNHSQLDDVYPTIAELPGKGSDPYLMIQVHTYDPWTFCGQTGRNSEYPGEASIVQSIKKVTGHASQLNVPLNFGEWGVGRDDNKPERDTDLVRNHYKLMRQTILAEGAAPTAWEDRGWFGLISVDGGTVSFTNNILPTMMED